MNYLKIIKEIIKHTKHDFISYFKNETLRRKAEKFIELAITGDDDLLLYKNEIELMTPDTNDDGSLECSYALNTSVLLLNLIDFIKTKDVKFYNESVVSFFDTVDFKTQNELEKAGNSRPTEKQISSHDYYIKEKKWFKNIVEMNS